MKTPLRSTALTLLFLALIGCPAAVYGQVRLNEVDYENGWVELFNTGDAPEDVSSYFLCTFPTYQPISSLNVLSGSTTIPAGGFLVVEWSATNFTESDGEVGLYLNNDNFGDADNMLDYMQYGASGNPRENVAVEAGFWEAGTTVALAPSGKTVSFFGGGTGAGNWDASNPTQGAANDVIPVELVSFEAVVDGRNVHLRWATASETNNAGFEVQHRRDASFEPVGFIEGQGTTTVPQTYRFTAQDLAPGVHAFRLKQLDFDGAFAFSSTIEATVEMTAPYTLSSVYPNPASHRAEFTLAVRETQTIAVDVYDVLGRHVATLYEGSLAAGHSHRFEIDGSGMTNGLYLIRTTGEHFSATRQVTLIK